MTYKVNWDKGVFAVPDSVVPLLKLATSKAIKVLLYILKNKSDDNITDSLGIEGEDLEEAISFWYNSGVFIKDNGEATMEKITDSSENTQTKETESIARSNNSTHSKNSSYYPEEIARKIMESDKMKYLFDSVENTLGHPLTYSEQRSVIWMSEDLKLPHEVIIMIYGYACSISRFSVSYIDKLACDWCDEGINTVTLADAKILELQKVKSLADKCVSRMFLSRKLNKKENETVKGWADKNIDIEIIMCAYDTMIDYIGKISFSYMDKILTDWMEHGIKTPEQAEKYIAEHEKRKPKKISGNKKPTINKSSLDFNRIMEYAKNTPLGQDSTSGK